MIQVVCILLNVSTHNTLDSGGHFNAAAQVWSDQLISLHGYKSMPLNNVDNDDENNNDDILINNDNYY